MSTLQNILSFQHNSNKHLHFVWGVSHTKKTDLKTLETKIKRIRHL